MRTYGRKRRKTREKCRPCSISTLRFRRGVAVGDAASSAGHHSRGKGEGPSRVDLCGVAEQKRTRGGGGVCREGNALVKREILEVRAREGLRQLVQLGNEALHERERARAGRSGEPRGGRQG